MNIRKLVSLAVIISVLSIATAALSADMFEPWGYVWLNGALYKTNLEKNDFNKVVGRVESKVGVHLMNLWGPVTLQPYLAYYGVMSEDLHSWNNNNVLGGGVQIMPLLGMKNLDWMQDLKVYAEVLSISWTSFSTPEGDPTYNPNTTDVRFGFDIWHEWNQPGPYKVENRAELWGEFWGNLSYRDTDFNYNKLQNYVCFIQPKLGIYAFKFFNNLSLEPYFKADIAFSGSDATYYNVADYGIGLRVRPFTSGMLFGYDMQPLKKLKFFVEVLAVSYLKGKTAEQPDHDFRIGIDFNFGR